MSLETVPQVAAGQRGLHVYQLFRHRVDEAHAARVQALAVDRVPTLIVLRDGAEVARCTGFQPEEILSLWLDAKLEA